ncbi:MAG: hypothetical protein Q4C50_03400 [Eubacteriales bacterium]|nr:hypothetical protein [Eubacteriales bacterium]
MKKKGKLLFLLSLCAVLSLTGCRKKLAETESETQSETVSEKQTETQTEKQTVKATEKSTSKSTSSTTKTTEKTKVKASTVTSETSSTTTTPTTEAYGTQQCPYCYQQISLEPNGDGTTVYSVHVAQEKAWADTYGYGDTPPTESTNAQTETQAQTQSTAAATEAPATAQCGYCYQWFTVADGSYQAHLDAENAALGMPAGTEYIQCPTCGYSFPKGSVYDTHVCITGN